MNKEDIRLSLTFVVLSRGEQKASTSMMLTLYVEQLKFCSTNFSLLWLANPNATTHSAVVFDVTSFKHFTSISFYVVYRLLSPKCAVLNLMQ